MKNVAYFFLPYHPYQLYSTAVFSCCSLCDLTSNAVQNCIAKVTEFFHVSFSRYSATRDGKCKTIGYVVHVFTGCTRSFTLSCILFSLHSFAIVLPLRNSRFILFCSRARFYVLLTTRLCSEVSLILLLITIYSITKLGILPTVIM